MVEKLSKDIREGQKYKKLFFNIINYSTMYRWIFFFTILQLRLNNFIAVSKNGIKMVKLII